MHVAEQVVRDERSYDQAVLKKVARLLRQHGLKDEDFVNQFHECVFSSSPPHNTHTHTHTHTLFAVHSVPAGNASMLNFTHQSYLTFVIISVYLAWYV